jgi:perosamine synthetase
MQAALGYAQLKRIDELVNKKREIFSWYKARLDNIPFLNMNAEPGGTKNSYWMTSVIIDEKLDWPKLKLMDALAEKNINTRPFFSPLSSIPAYKNNNQAKIAQKRNKNAYSVSLQGINLPSALILEENDIEYVCHNLIHILQEKCK